MKRKRRGVHGSGNENLPTSSTYSRQISPAGLHNQVIPLRDCSDSTVPLTSVFNRVYQTIGSSPSTTTFDPLHAAQGSSSASPHTPSTAPVRLFGKPAAYKYYFPIYYFSHHIITCSNMKICYCCDIFLGVDLTLNQPSCSTVHRSCLTNANCELNKTLYCS